MPHDTSLIAGIIISLIFAFGFGYAARRLHLPPLVGYLLAGVVIGPLSTGLVTDVDLASQLAEIGIILLMFGVGLHFSLKDLLSVWSIAVPGALAQIVVSVAAGAVVSSIWGWSLGAGVLFGLALSVASTAVLLRVLEDQGTLDSSDGRIAVGWLIAQDLTMILALVLLPPLANFQANAEANLIIDITVTLGKVAVFMVLVLVVGRRALPWFLARTARTGSRELFTLGVLACALGIAYGSAMLFGVSLALGAFFAGVVLSESDLSYQAAADSLPLQDAFAVLFFVSVGMLFDPKTLIEDPTRIAVVLVLILLVKSLPAFIVILASGQSLASAFIITAGLAQVGEFSFILASLGISLNVLSDEGRDLILAGSMLSIALNPLLFVQARNAALWLENREALQSWINRRMERRQNKGLVAPFSPVFSKHVIIVGYGRVGSLVSRTLVQLHLPVVIVERDRKMAENLRAQGHDVIWGDASAPTILDAAGIRRADLLVIATPSGFHTRRILEITRQGSSSIQIVARAHTDIELTDLERRGVNMAAMGERELALAMIGYVLRGFGMGEDEAARIVQELRTSTRVGSGFMQEGSFTPRGAPELERESESS